MEKALVSAVKFIVSVTAGAVDFQREFPIPFTGGKRILVSGWKGNLRNIEFCRQALIPQLQFLGRARVLLFLCVRPTSALLLRLC